MSKNSYIYIYYINYNIPDNSKKMSNFSINDNKLQEIILKSLPKNDNNINLQNQIIYNENSQVTFNELIRIFNRYPYYKGEYCDEHIIGTGIPEIRTNSKGVKYINISISYIAAFSSGKYTLCPMEFNIPYYSGKKQLKLDDLPIIPVFDIELERDIHIARGLIFSDLTREPSYRHAKGYMFIPIMFGFKRLPINSRVVIDPKGYKKNCSADRWHRNEELDQIPEDLLMSTLPTVPIYSLEYRMWGEVPVNNLSVIKFDDTAFDRVILSDEYKKLVRGLVGNFYKTECYDFIAGRKKGLVFLLNGNPGTGKTLTAQSIAELTHRPLYCVGSGDLGTNPKEIEKNLENILNMVESWGGIVLIDEADVFMNVRTDYNIDYNACASVFLRLIETYLGILFLTTNRGNSIDPAFDSRIHIKLQYEDLEDEGRSKVWNESFKRYGIKNIDLKKLKTFKLNNREIANIVQLSYVEVGGDSSKITEKTILNYIKLRLDF